MEAGETASNAEDSVHGASDLSILLCLDEVAKGKDEACGARDEIETDVDQEEVVLAIEAIVHRWDCRAEDQNADSGIIESE